MRLHQRLLYLFLLLLFYFSLVCIHFIQFVVIHFNMLDLVSGCIRNFWLWQHLIFIFTKLQLIFCLLLKFILNFNLIFNSYSYFCRKCPCWLFFRCCKRHSRWWLVLLLRCIFNFFCFIYSLFNTNFWHNFRRLFLILRNILHWHRYWNNFQLISISNSILIINLWLTHSVRWWKILNLLRLNFIFSIFLRAKLIFFIY